MNKNNTTILIYLVIVSLLNFLLTFMIKYDLNALSISNFNLFYIGNLIPIAMEGVLLLFILGQMLNKNSLLFSHKLSLAVLISTTFILVLASYLIVKMGVSFPSDYLFSYPLKKVSIGGALLLSLILKLYIITLLLNLFFNKGFVVYLKSLFTTIFILIISFGSIFVFTIISEYNEDNLKPSNNSIGVVLGAAVWNDAKPSPIFKGRIEKASELIRNKKISKIQLTGSNAPGEISEARTAYKYGLNLGIKKHLMLLEEKTTTTTEQIKYIKKELSGSRNYTSILIISDQFHLTRVLEICKFFDVKAVGIASNYKINWEKLLYYRFRESVALLFFWLFAI
ncbi:MAG: YdcF family protein [Melioribacteraceae bacterium]|nr:YdcF family protein [Melioribacteraceae bacterium]